MEADGYPVLENVECVGEFASLFRADYDRMKLEGTDINTFLEGYLVSGEYDHTVYDPVKDFISGLLDITIIKPIIECFTGEDLITGATLSDLERALKLGGAIVDLFTLGQAMVLTKGAGLGAKAIGKTVILELASNAAVYSVGYGCDALGMPVVASWGLSILTGCTVSAVGGKYLFKDSSGNVIKECTSLEAEQILKRGAELDGNAKTYVDWMLPKDAEVFLQYKATGSLDGLSEADINSIRKLEELIELKQVEYQDIFNVRNKDEVLARNSKVHRVEDVAGDGNVRNRKGQSVEETVRTLDMALDPETYAYAIAEKYGINLKGSGQDIIIKYNPELRPGIYGRTTAANPNVIEIGPDALISETELANTIAHELNHARDFIRGGVAPEETAYRAGDALSDYINGGR